MPRRSQRLGLNARPFKVLDFEDLSQRWSRVTRLMEALDLDVVVAIDWSRDEILLSGQRWLTGFTPLGGPAAALVFRDGRVELVSQWLGRTAPAFYAESGLPIETVVGFSPTLFADRIGRVSPKRVGYAEDGAFPASLDRALRNLPSSPDLVDISADLVRLRLVKSEAEVRSVRRSCAIADTVWEGVADFFKVGRKFYEILADVDHRVRLQGAEGGFYLLAKLPVLGMPMRVLADPEEVVSGGRYMLEISPRFDGYYSQLTLPVSTVAGHDAAVQAYRDVVEAKAFAQPLMTPGADLTAIAAQVEAFLAERGQAMASRSLGHFCGMALEEPRHDPSKPFLLEKGMTLIFHPVLVGPEITSLMRADTYLIGDNGAERLNKLGMDMLQIG